MVGRTLALLLALGVVVPLAMQLKELHSQLQQGKDFRSLHIGMESEEYRVIELMVADEREKLNVELSGLEADMREAVGMQKTLKQKVEDMEKRNTKAQDELHQLTTRIKHLSSFESRIDEAQRRHSKVLAVHQDLLNQVQQASQRVQREKADYEKNIEALALQLQQQGGSQQDRSRVLQNIGAIKDGVNENEAKLAQLHTLAAQLEKRLADAVPLEELAKSRRGAIARFQDEVRKIGESSVKTWVQDLVSNSGDAISCLTSDDVSTFVQKAIQVRAADDVGMKDYALAQNSGTIVETHTSPTFNVNNAIQGPSKGFWPSRTYLVGGPTEAISAGVAKGECFPFSGSSGNLTVKLGRPIFPSHVTLEHLSKLIGEQGGRSAPRNYQVWGYENQEKLSQDNGILLVESTYEIDAPDPIQMRRTLASTKIITFARLEVLSNHDVRREKLESDDYTCIYRFRVHGKEA